MPLAHLRRICMNWVGVVILCAASSALALVPLALIAQGDEHWAAGKLDLAQQSFQQAVAAEPLSVAAHMKLAGLQLSRLDFKACIQTYQQTISLDGKNAKAWLGLGFAYLHTSQNQLSLAAFNEAIRIDPSTRDKLGSVLANLSKP